MARAYDETLDARAAELEAAAAEQEAWLETSRLEAELERENAAKVMAKAIEAEAAGQKLRDDNQVILDNLMSCIANAGGTQ